MAWSVLGESFIRARVGASPEDLKRIWSTSEAEHRARLEGLLSEVDTSKVEPATHLHRGNPSIIIPQHVRELGADLLVMGTVGRSGIAGFLIGNTAERVLAEVECPILAIKPTGFVTPVQV
jgi:nucleotide-binding universal stress UspA family protein